MMVPGQVRGSKEGPRDRGGGVLPMEGLWLRSTLPHSLWTSDPHPRTGQATECRAAIVRAGRSRRGQGLRSPHQWCSTSLIR